MPNADAPSSDRHGQPDDRGGDPDDVRSRDADDRSRDAHGRRPTTTELADQVSELLSDAEPAVYHQVLRTVALRRPWRPEHRGWRNVKDQVLHVVYAAAILLPVLAWPSYGTAAASGLVLGGLREWEQFRGQDLRILMLRDRLLDVATFVLGAVLVFHLSR